MGQILDYPTPYHGHRPALNISYTYIDYPNIAPNDVRLNGLTAEHRLYSRVLGCKVVLVI